MTKAVFGGQAAKDKRRETRAFASCEHFCSWNWQPKLSCFLVAPRNIFREWESLECDRGASTVVSSLQDIQEFFEFFLVFFGGDFSANSAFLVVVSVFAAAFGACGSRSLHTALELLWVWIVGGRFSEVSDVWRRKKKKQQKKKKKKKKVVRRRRRGRGRRRRRRRKSFGAW